MSPPLLVCLLFLARLGHHDLVSSHEARAAQIAQRMLDTGEWGLPVLFDGRADLQKPPLYYWAVAAAGRLNGGRVDEWVTRVPAALAGLGCVLLVYGFLRAERRPTAAAVAAVVLATANHFTGISRTARIDVPLACAVTAALLAFYRGCALANPGPEPGGDGYLRARARGSPAIVWHLLAGLAAGLAVLLKGPVALALIGPATVAWLVVERPRVPLPSWFLIPLVAAAAALPWFVWANAATGGEFLRVFFWHHTIARFAGTAPTLATHPWWYYAPRFAFDFLPWTPVFLGLVAWAMRSGPARTDRPLRFALIAFAGMVAVLSTAKFKRADYLLPAYPFAAIAVGCAAEAWLAARPDPASVRRGKWGFGVLVAAAVVAWLGVQFVVEPREQAREEKRRFAAVVRDHAPAPHVILQFRMESHLLSYHLGRPVHTFVEWGELNELLAAPGPHFVVMPPEYVHAAGRIVTSRNLVEVTRLEDHTAAKPQRPLVFLRTE